MQHPTEPNENEPTCRGEWVDFGGKRDGGRGYLAHSDRVGPSVLLLHQWYGLQPAFTKLADRLCAEGFTVLVPDLYDGYIASNDEEATAKVRSLDHEANSARTKAAAAFLTDNWHPRLGVIGLSLGAGYAAWVAQEIPIEATVLYYGVGDVDSPKFSGPILLHLAENDAFDPPDYYQDFVKAVEGNVDIDVHTYPGTEHSFAISDFPEYDEGATELAFGRTVEFLRHNLA